MTKLEEAAAAYNVARSAFKALEVELVVLDAKVHDVERQKTEAGIAWANARRNLEKAAHESGIQEV